MATSKSKHVVEISAVDKITGTIRGIEARFKGLGSVIDRSLGVIGIGGVAALTGALVKSVKMAGEEEQVMKRLAVVIENTGRSYTGVDGQVRAVLKSQQMLTRFADDESAVALTNLVAITGNYERSLAALPVVTDLAETGLFSLESASTAVGKALTGNTMLLQRTGIQIEKTDDVLKVLSERFGGTAVKAADTFAGRVAQLRNTVSDLFEALGTPLIGALGTAATKLRDTLAQPEVQRRIEELANSIAEKIPKAVEKLVGMSNWVINNGDKILKFFTALVAVRVTSWALSSASAIATLIPKLLELAPLLASNPYTAVAAAGAAGTAVGWNIGEYVAGQMRQSRYNSYQPLPLSNEAARSLGMYSGGYSLPEQVITGAVDKIKKGGEDIADALREVAHRTRRYMPFEDPYGERGTSKVLGSQYDDRPMGAYGIGYDKPLRRQHAGRDPYGIPGAQETLSQSWEMTKEGKQYWLEYIDAVQATSGYVMSAMSSITQSIVRGIEQGTLRIKDLFNALKSAVLQIIADLAARLATAGILSLIFPQLGFGNALGGLFGGGFSGGRTNSVARPAPVGVRPGGSSFGGAGGVTVVFQGNVYGDANAISDIIEERLQRRLKLGTSRILRANS